MQIESCGLVYLGQKRIWQRAEGEGGQKKSKFALLYVLLQPPLNV